MRENKPTNGVEEGPRSFSVFLQNIAEGEAEIECARQLQELTRCLMDEMDRRRDKVAGSLNLRVKVLVDTAGHAAISYAVTQSKPARKTSGAIFWVTKGGNLSVSDPRQKDLPGIKAVPLQGPPREIPVDNKSRAAGETGEES